MSLNLPEDFYTTIFKASPLAIAVTRQDTSVILEVNEAYCQLIGYPRDEIIGKTAIQLGIWTDLSIREKIIQTAKETGALKGIEAEIRSRNGDLKYIDIAMEHLMLAHKRCFIIMLVDITSRKKVQIELERANETANRFREALDNVPAYIFIKNKEHQYVYGNKKTLELFKVTSSEINGTVDSAYFPPATGKRLYDIDTRVLSGENTAEEIIVADGPNVTRVYWEVKSPIHQNNEIWGLVGISTDITQHRELEKRLEQQANTDYLTGLPNRNHFFKVAHGELSRAIRYKEPLSIGMLDLDFFKNINDTYGHEIGDRVLREVADICRASLRESDIVARIGGEEFAILWPETNYEQALEAAERLRYAIDIGVLPLEKGLPVNFTASIGVASLVSEKMNLDTLLGLADQALYAAKHAGRNRVVGSQA